MKIVFPEINHVFDTDIDKIQTLVIENPKLLLGLLKDIRNQLDGTDGRCIVSNECNILQLQKSLDLITDFTEFSINRKALVNKATTVLEKSILQGELYSEAMELMQKLESLLLKASYDIGGDVFFSKISFPSILKAAGMEFREEYESLPEKIIDYMELVSVYEGKKLFVLYNLRSLISDDEAELFVDTVLRHGFDVLMIESYEHKRLENEVRYIVDESLCEIC